MKKYIGVKLIDAEPMTHGDYAKEKYGENQIETKFSENNKNTDGYKVTYADGYVSWSPKEVFEMAYMPLTDPDGKRICQEDVDNFLMVGKDCRFGEKTFVFHATLRNGFEIVESSSCVDAANYDANIGMEICTEKIKNKVWELLGFLLQCAKGGMR